MKYYIYLATSYVLRAYVLRKTTYFECAAKAHQVAMLR
jgi:hypothetical protein